MHHHHHGRRLGRRFGRFDRETFLARLEEYRKDLEQELADVSDLIRRLQDSEPAPTQSA